MRSLNAKTCWERKIGLTISYNLRMLMAFLVNKRNCTGLRWPVYAVGDIITGYGVSRFYQFIHSTTNIYLVLTLGLALCWVPVIESHLCLRSAPFQRRNKQMTPRFEP